MFQRAAYGRLTKLQTNLQDTYGDMYDREWNIILRANRTTISTPAFTTFEGDNTIEIVFSRWFLEGCSYGELLGMANHEMAVHYFADISLASGFSIEGRKFLVNMGMGTEKEINDYFKDNQNQPKRYMEEKLVENAYQTTNSPGGEPWKTTSMTNINKEIPIDSEKTYDKRFDVTFVDRESLTLESPETIVKNGGQADHAYMSHISLLLKDNKAIFSPRAAVYARMCLKALDKFISSCPDDNTGNEMAKQEGQKILGYYFLDIARTWEEGIRGKTLNAISTMRKSQMRIEVTAMAKKYFNWLIGTDGVPNSELEETLSPRTITILRDIRPDMVSKLGQMNDELTNLMWRGLASMGGGVKRLASDMYHAPVNTGKELMAASLGIGKDALYSAGKAGARAGKAVIGGVAKAASWMYGKAKHTLGFGKKEKKA